MYEEMIISWLRLIAFFKDGKNGRGTLLDLSQAIKKNKGNNVLNGLKVSVTDMLVY